MTYNPPAIGPIAEPPTDENTMKATAYCWSSCSHMSATIPRVTDPPADESPPRNRPTTIVPKLGANAQGICQTTREPREDRKMRLDFEALEEFYPLLTRNKLNCKTGHRPSSSLQGAQSSLPNAYLCDIRSCQTLATFAETAT